MAKTILFLAANPVNTEHLRLDEELREIDSGLQRAKYRDNFVLQQRLALRTDDLRRAMLDFEPEIVHFSGHGAGSDGLVLEDSSGHPQLMSTEAIQGLFRLFPKVECVVLNACYSAVQAKAIAEQVRYVIGMHRAVGDAAAIKFSIGFYEALGAGKSVEFAYELGWYVMTAAGTPEELKPVL
jgi:CHAT domain-containing protein